MPFYEYQCTACTHQTEELQKVTDPPLIECPACHKNTLEKKISNTAFRLTGGGWYETDFKDKKPQPKSEASASNTTAPTSEKPRDKKPEKTDKPAATET